ncbi:MAG: ABC transporter permease [Promethearchaeota archaeon]|nr:MAG: ABC transporter permease [Candidatus Lokiarchaeota archaeon]
MAFRLWRKAVLMTLREKKTFTAFTLIYTSLIFLTSLFIELSITGAIGQIAGYFVAIFFGVSLFLSLLYSWIIVSRNRRTWATLKCIGYTNKDINSLVTGKIFFTTLIGFIIVIEILFHYTASIGYLQSATIYLGVPLVLIGLGPVIVTFAIFIIVQLIAIIVANRRIYKVRPIIALKKVGE